MDRTEQLIRFHSAQVEVPRRKREQLVDLNGGKGVGGWGALKFPSLPSLYPSPGMGGGDGMGGHSWIISTREGGRSEPPENLGKYPGDIKRTH